MLSSTWSHTDNAYYRPRTGNPIYFEYVSKYRRILVVGVGEGFEMRVSYKGIDLPNWSKNYGVKADAIGWAKVQTNNRDIVLGSLTIREAAGVIKIQTNLP